MKKIFTRQEAIDFLGCNQNAMPIRIIESLERCGFKNIEKVGRGQKLTFVCEQPDDTDEQCYYIFRDILINEFGYGKRFNYDLALEIIEFHINNKEYTSLEEISNIIESQPCKSTIKNHREKLSKQVLKGAKRYGIVKKTNDCSSVTMGGLYDSKEVQDITEIYETVIINSFREQLKKLNDLEKRSDVYVTIYADYHIRDYKIIIRDNNTKETHDELCYQLKEKGYNHYGTYMLWWHLLTSKDICMNERLIDTLYRVNLKCFGFDYIFYRRLYQITEELQGDEELLNVIKKSIKFMKNNKK